MKSIKKIVENLADAQEDIWAVMEEYTDPKVRQMLQRVDSNLALAVSALAVVEGHVDKKARDK